MAKELELKYGCNPNQKPSRIFMQQGELPIEVLNGRPGYINFLDAFNSWQLGKELKEATGLPAAASFKHVSPAGAAVGIEMNDTLKKIYFVDDLPLTPLATAYARARGADRMSSYGDFIALSDICDEATARLINREVSDGVIAPDYTLEALEILKNKRKGTYNIIKIDPDYCPAPIEHKDVFGITFEQGRNEIKLDENLLTNIPTLNKNFPDEAKRDLIIALITLKYTQSNSVCYVKGRTGHRYRCRPAKPYPLYPSGGQQGRYLVLTPASESNESALDRENPSCRPRQHDRRLHQRRPRRCFGRRYLATVFH